MNTITCLVALLETLNWCVSEVIAQSIYMFPSVQWFLPNTLSRKISIPS